MALPKSQPRRRSPPQSAQRTGNKTRAKAPATSNITTTFRQRTLEKIRASALVPRSQPASTMRQRPSAQGRWKATSPCHWIDIPAIVPVTSVITRISTQGRGTASCTSHQPETTANTDDGQMLDEVSAAAAGAGVAWMTWPLQAGVRCAPDIESTLSGQEASFARSTDEDQMSRSMQIVKTRKSEYTERDIRIHMDDFRRSQGVFPCVTFSATV
ncbi:hypothetical protein HPB51_027838 [Rhipicephalus microplus]|uniref:Uncharacterized protein n=1 Tax=Rhipicephalus microplus TaxID=6941 RepID=A0A9J6CYZ6_RHIMP|nr:hypothetical protein HPB51_027838 [Rhipicephalus microplus]